MKFLKSPQSYPYILVILSAVITLFIINSGELSLGMFPLLLFLSTKFCILFGSIEAGLALIGKYPDKDSTYKAASRAITAFSMAVCFVIILSGFEAARGN